VSTLTRGTAAGRRRWLVAGALAMAGCSAGDPPDPDAAPPAPPPASDLAPGSPSASASPAGGSDAGSVAPDDHDDAHDAEGEELEAEGSDADDATLDALEERFEAQGVKDIRDDPVDGVTIRLEDELTIADAAAVCAAVRAAGFASVSVELDGVAAACP